MDDHELIVRMDERIDYISKSIECNIKEIEDLKKWKNSMAGGLSVILGLLGYTYLF